MVLRVCIVEIELAKEVAIKECCLETRVGRESSVSRGGAGLHSGGTHVGGVRRGGVTVIRQGGQLQE